jgi:hypothetical protein
MSETKGTTADQLLEEFAALSPEDQEAVRARLLKGQMPDKGGACCEPAAMMQMMEKMTAKGSAPMAMCKEMMAKMGGGQNPMAMCQQMRQGNEGECC